MLWYELTAAVPPLELEPVMALMEEVAPGGLAIEEPIDILGPEMGFRVRDDAPTLVRVYVPASELGAVLVEELRRSLEAFPSVEMTARPIYEQDWAVAWREFFHVVHAGPRMVIVPTWEEYTPDPDDVVIRLDPGQAFGTGHHETTRLCLAALAETVTPGMEVLDVGTGSGILAVGAILLGARGVHAIDIDPVAIDVARANAADNGTEDAITWAKGSLDPTHEGRYDLIIANISAEVNAKLVPAYAAVARPGATVLLSGILTIRVADVRAEMERHGFRLVRFGAERDWSLLQFVASGR